MLTAPRCPLAAAVLAVVALGWPEPLPAQPASARHTKVSLVAEADAVRPGKPLTVGLRLVMEPGWHTYWRNPGDSGLPTRVKWTLPPGFSAGEIRWPHPIRFPTGPLVSYGYEKEVLLPVELQVPAPLEVQEVQLAARVDWLECQEICLPGKADVSLTLPVRAKPALGPNAALFAEARRRLPARDAAWRVTSAAGAASIRLDFAPPKGLVVDAAYFYAVTPRVVDYSKPQPFEPAKPYRLVLPRDPNGPTPQRLAGVLVADCGGLTKAVEVDVPFDGAARR